MKPWDGEKDTRFDLYFEGEGVSANLQMSKVHPTILYHPWNSYLPTSEKILLWNFRTGWRSAALSLSHSCSSKCLNFPLSLSLSLKHLSKKLYGWVSLSVTRFGEILTLLQDFKVSGHFLRIYLEFGKMLNLLWQIFHANGQIFNASNGQI